MSNKMLFKIDDKFSIQLQVDVEKSNMTRVMIVGQLFEDDSTNEYHSVMTFDCNVITDQIEFDVKKSKISTHELVEYIGNNFELISVNLQELIVEFISTNKTLPNDTKEFNVELNLPYPSNDEHYDLGVLREYVKNYLMLQHKFIIDWKCSRINFNKIDVKVNDSLVTVNVTVKKVY